MSEITAFTGTIEGRFVDDDDLRQSGRAWVEIDNATGLLTLPVSAEYQALRSEVVESAEAAAGSAGAAESARDTAASARDAAVIARDEAEGHAAAAAGSAQAADSAAGRAETAAGSTQWVGDRLTVMGVQSPPLTGPQGPQGPPGAAGDGTGDVLWSELNPVLDGKANASHTHTKADITDLETISLTATANHLVKRTTGGNITVPTTPNASGSAASKSYVDTQIATRAPVSHQHSMADITGLGDELDERVPWSYADPSATGNTVAYRTATGALRVAPATDSDHAVTKAQLDTVDARITTRKGVIHSGTGGPPTSIPGAVVGDWWLNETTMELHKITGL